MKSSVFLGILFVFATLSLRAQSQDDSTFSLSPGDVTEATIDTSGRTKLQVMLTPRKRVEFAAFTGRDLNKQVKIVLGGKLRSEPFIRERVAGPSMEIFVSSLEDALATVRTLLTSTVTFDQLHKWTDSSGQTHYSQKPLPSSGAAQNSSAPAPADSGEVLYAKNCAVCHGAGARGGDRAPGLANNRGLRSHSEDQIAAVIRTGIPGRMPPFELPDSELKTLAAWVCSFNISAFDAKPGGDPSAGEQFFFGTGQCASCHMVAGIGKANGPDLSDTGRSF